MKKHKHNLLFLIIIFSLNVSGQSWQWGKKGGSSNTPSTTGGSRQEETRSLVTDSHKNIYGLSTVGRDNLNVDGNLITSYDYGTYPGDVLLYSLSCDGTYRWSKLFSGFWQDNEYVTNISIDAQDNIYLAGGFSGGGGGSTCYPDKISNNVTFPQCPLPDYDITFIIKYNSNGVFQWLKRIRPPSQDFSNQLGIYGLSTDNLGNSYALAWLGPGTFCDGALTVTGTDHKFYILKYDTNGNFINATYLDIVFWGTTSISYTRNPYNGYYYFSGNRGASTDTAVIGAQPVTHSCFIWCFNDLGQFQWLKETSSANYNTIFWYNFAFDPQNNIYISGYITGGNYENFLGMSPSAFNNPPFVMKLNAAADTVLWSSYPSNGGRQTGAIVLNGNEIAVTTTCSGGNYVWGSQTFAPGGTNQGTEVLFARLNKDTGACTALTKIPGDIGYDDCGTALAVDASGDYILGGALGHQLTFTNNTLLNIYSQTDFFISKYSTNVCSLGTEDFKEDGLELYPNPVESMVKVNTVEDLKFAVYSMTGILVKEGTLTQQQNSIDVAGLSAGTYILQTTNDSGAVKKAKLLKK